jgi:hypothetical protein
MRLKETQYIELKESWRDGYLKATVAFHEKYIWNT